MITKDYFHTLLPEIIHVISSELPLRQALALSTCCKRLNELAGRHFWERLCEQYDIQLKGGESPRLKFIVELNDQDPSKLYKFGNFLFYHVGEIKLAKAYFERADKLCTSSSELSDSIKDQINRIYYLYHEGNTLTQIIFSSVSNYLFPVNENTNRDTKELEILKSIKHFREEVLNNLHLGWYSKYNNLKVINSPQIPSKLYEEAISFYCYSWAIYNLPTDGKEIFEGLISTENLSYSVRNRIQIIKAIRQFQYKDAGLTFSEAARIFKATCKNEKICLTERLIAQYLLISVKTIAKVDDEILTFKESFELANDINSYTFQVCYIRRLYFRIISLTKLCENSNEVPDNLLMIHCIHLSQFKYDFIKTITSYYQLFVIKRYDAAHFVDYKEGSNLKNWTFEEIFGYLKNITEDPPTCHYGIMRHTKITDEANALLCKYNELQSMNFHKLSNSNQKKILTCGITDASELQQEINLCLAEDYFNSYYSESFTHEAVIDMLKSIVDTPLNSDEEMTSRWEERKIMAFKYLNKQSYINETCILQ